ncbi:hypothetical protein HUS84_03080 [Pseudomonas chlororaphis]|uniref:hypothetical protein n=1 Tax=Pseudomonas chlororaphis TaxID=587753 RepID=UPI001B335033|nr:hypothetical protein [Pseudomonas chlororaphis]MBP5073001.1 hypothetical protein [Pseudomonas chlororaphis]
MKKKTKAALVSLALLLLSTLFIPGFLERSKNNSVDKNQAFIEHYIPTTKKAEECLATDQQLNQESSLLAGTSALALTEFQRIAQENFKPSAEYEIIISIAVKNFSASQDSYAKTLKTDQDCWKELSRQMEQTALALNVYEKFKTPDQAMVTEEAAINTKERALVSKLGDSVDMNALYESFVTFTSTKDEKKMREIFSSITPVFESLVTFYGQMVGVSQQRAELKQKYYQSKKQLFAEKIEANKDTGILGVLWPF